MLAQRMIQQSTRRLAAKQPTPFLTSRLLAPTAISISNTRIQSRPATTQTQVLTPDSAHEILIKQRRNRPVSPHLSIYKPQITWYGSGLNRITAVTLSGGFYIFGAAYLASPLFGWHLDSASMAAAFAGWPMVAKVLVKFGVALPFTYHTLNGVRHLVWDTGREFSNKQVQRTGWMVVGATVVGSGVLAYI